MTGCTPSELTVYFGLLHFCNKLGWINPFSLPNARVASITGLSKNTIVAARDKLVSRGLIQFKGGKRRESAPVYCFPEIDDGKEYFPWSKNLRSNFDPKTDLKTDPKTDPKADPKTDPINKNKDIRNKEKYKKEKGSEGELFSERQMRQPKVKSAKGPPQTPPSLEEVRAYFKQVGADVKLENWQNEADSFWSYFDSLDWHNSKGRKIARWESRANLWILDKEKEQKNAQQQKNTAKARPSDAESEWRERRSKIENYVARNIGNNSQESSGAKSDLPF